MTDADSVPPACANCKHWRRDDDDEDGFPQPSGVCRQSLIWVFRLDDDECDAFDARRGLR